MSAAPGQHHRHPRVKRSPCRCKRMGWRFRSGNGPEEFGTAGNRHGVSAWGAVPGAGSPEGTGTGTAVPCGCVQL